jgi:phage terminase large subunit-like protein
MEIKTRLTSSRVGVPNAPRPDDAATRYAVSVTEGRTLACKWVTLACQRHLDDLRRSHETPDDFPYRWDAFEVDDMRMFFTALHHSKGEWAPKSIKLEPWQLFILGSLWGWKRLSDGMRRFRLAYVEIGRKNGKSTLAAGVALRLAFTDDEPGAEVYCVATKLKQAKIVWDEAKRMVLNSPSLKRHVHCKSTLIEDPELASRVEPLGQDSDKLDGLNIHGATVDEFHAHTTPRMLDVIDTGTGARRQPLLFIITTAGFNLASPCYERRGYVTKILERTVPDESVFGIIYTIDAEDRWEDPKAWIKANPMLDISVKMDELKQQAKRAFEIPSARTAFLTKRLNVWINADNAEVDMAAWMRGQGEINLDELYDAPCWIGIDLASKSDLAAVVPVFAKEGHVWIRPMFYLPRAAVEAQSHAATAHYAGWAASGHLTLTEGDLIDFSVIREDIMSLASRVGIQELCFDPYNASHLRLELHDLGMKTVEIPQNVRSFSGPMYTMRDLLKSGRFHHDGNPVMTWCASNVVSKEDANENLFPRKAARDLKIDGYTALLDAMARATVAEGTSSVYEDRGALVI